MRILLLSQWFDPEPTLKGLAFARALARDGNRVEVLTGFPNYPGGRIYPGYRQRLVQRGWVDGIRIVRVPLFPSHDASGLRRAVGYVSFAASAISVGGWATSNPDVIYAYHPPLTTGIAAALLSGIKRAPFVLDIQDLWPDTLSVTGMIQSETLLRVVDALCRLLYRRATRITVLSPGFKRALVARGVPEHKVEVIYNWVDEDRLSLVPETGTDAPLKKDDRFNVVFAGTMGKAQGLDTVLDAAQILLARLPLARFVLVGGGIEVPRLEAECRRRGLSNVEFLPAMPMESVGGVLAVADALLVHLCDDPLFSITIPSKTQAYLAAGKPILMAVSGDAAELVARSDAGVTCAPEDALALADAVVGLAGMAPEELVAMGRRGANFYASELSLREGAARFLRVLGQAAGES